jgi:hypothetical protein
LAGATSGTHRTAERSPSNWVSKPSSRDPEGLLPSTDGGPSGPPFSR